MSADTVTLREGHNSVTLLPSSANGLAEVVGGNVHFAEDIVSCPVEGLSWIEAAKEEEIDGDTHISPFDLQVEEDGITGYLLTQFEDSDPLDVQFPRSEREAVDDEFELMNREDVRILSELINRPKERNHRSAKESRFRRRHSDTDAA